MTIRFIGACFILFSCGSFGFLISRSAKKEIYALENFVIAMEYMECELRYRMTPLPNLCCKTASVTKGTVSKLFELLCSELEAQISPNVSVCMSSALYKCRDVPGKIVVLWESMTERLGIFDLDGQIRVLSSLREEAKNMLKLCKQGHDARSRSYKTIAVCAGAAIVILLI